MGFFSSRKAEDNDSYQVTIGVGGATSDKSVVQVIRSRFYGKKGKEREQRDSYQSGASAAETLSTSLHVPVTSSPLASSRRSVSTTRPRSAHIDRPLLATPSKKPLNEKPPSTPTSTQSGNAAGPSYFKAQSTYSSTSPRKHTDTVTVTLAQRLNELSAANSEGLLNDDEYRILRQNLFERFSSTTLVPTESPVVPAAATPSRQKKGSMTPDRPTSRPLSNFQVEIPRPTSFHSKASTASGMMNIFRQGSTRRSSSKDASDTSSVLSRTSTTSNFFVLPRILSKKSSSSSIRTDTSRTQTDTISVSSRRRGSERSHTENSAPLSPAAPRSTAGSIRRMAVPPSSFPTRIIAQDNRFANPIYNVFDEDNLGTVQEITQEILNVEAEAKRLMDAFNGLEVTTLARAQRHHIRPSLKSADLGRGSNPDTGWGMDSDGRSHGRTNLADDTISMRSGTSVGTAPSVSASMSRSVYSSKKAPRTKASISLPLTLNPNSRPGSLHRKNSSSSVTSAAMPPPVPALPYGISSGHPKGANASNVSLSRSTGHLPMNTVPEDDQSVSGTTVRTEADDYENEMEDIRRRREEVSLRYEARLEYLRAKLKGAQLHEKLMRK